MDISDLNQDTFDSVWSKVTECAGHFTDISDCSDKTLLESLITKEVENRVFYISTAKACTKCTPLFKNLADLSAKRLGRLQAIYFLLYGNSFTLCEITNAASPSILAALRSAYWREADTASSLIAAAGTLRNGKFAALAAEFARQAAGSAELILQFIDKIMN